MAKKQAIVPIHRHILGVAIVGIIAVLFGVLVYPKLAILAELPTKPQGLSVNVDADNAVATWSAPALEGDTPVVGYNISYYETSRPGSAITDSVDNRTLEYSIALSGLVAGVEYTFEISASNSGGAGDLNTAVFNTPAAAVPSAPVGCSATAGDTEVYLLCSEPADLAGGTVISYLVYYGTRDYTSIEVPSTKGLTYSVTSLTNDVEYNFYVTAKNSNDVEGEASAVFTATPVAAGGGGGGDPEDIVISTSPVVTPAATSAVITWATNVAASSKVEFGPMENFKGETAEYNTDSRVTSHSVTIENLTSCAGYWYKVVSSDAGNTVVMSDGGEFKTTGCKGDSAIITYDVGKITTIAGATVEAKVSGRGIEAEAPANLKDGLAEMAVQALKLEKERVQEDTSVPTGKQWLGEAYSLKAFEDESTEFEEDFDQPVEVTIDYTAADVQGLDVNGLKIYHYTDGIGWEVLSNCNVDKSAMRVTCETTSFSIFGLFGEAPSSAGSSTGGYKNTSTSVPTTPSIVTTPAPSGTPAAAPASSVDLSYDFQNDLAFESQGVDVKMLQKFLNSIGFSLAPSGFGAPGMETEYFGPRTKAALIRFQDAYKAEILTPQGLSRGTGFFGSATRALVNSMLK